MFKKILIANRGEIACRVAATARRLGVKTVAVYSDADAHAKHVMACDEAVHVGASAPKESYLQWQRIIDAAKATGAEAIHPGYGFLAENADLARACAEYGITWIGPPPEAIEAMGSKTRAREIMAEAGVPIVPGATEPAPNLEAAAKQAEEAGFPVACKAAGGGGGKGFRVAMTPDDLEEAFMAALESCKREAINSFGDDAVLVEKYVQRPRHIEIQVFGDTQGNCVYLFERDCSVQRRHQKVLEEAPAPGMPESLRQKMGEAAVAAARAVGYVGAGTVEFIVEQPGGYEQPEAMKFYFMEMNTRLQVEHPVTEAITGQDLVEWQLMVASGEPLPLAQDELVLDGHAIEARICAENPDKNFLPATGTLRVYRKPPAVSFDYGEVRIDDGVREGDAISPFYDSMIAKLIVHGATREEALARLDAALAEVRIVGLQTNVQFLRRVLATPSFSQARLDTALIERERASLFEQDPLGTGLTVAAAVAQTLLEERASETHDPFSRRDGWRSHGVASRRFDFKIAGQPLVAKLRYLDDGVLMLQVGEDEFQPLDLTPVDGRRIDLRCAGRRQVVPVFRQDEDMHVFGTDGASVITELDMLSHAGEGAGEGGRLTAPMPGKVVSFSVKVGDKVRIVEGSFRDFNGTVDEVYADKGKARVLVSFFNRETPIEVDLLQIERL